MSDPTRKIAIVGAGAVGATIAYASLIRRIARNLALYDIDAKKVNAQTLDLNHGLLFTGPASIAGEHGDSEIPLWSSATIANIPLHEWAVMHHGKLSVPDRVAIFENVRTAAYQIVAGKGATNFAIGLATAQILQAILHDENR